ncbi:MAG: hypothetical protein R6X12_04275 [bacterium]
METPCWQAAPVDTARLHFGVVHSLFKQTVARVGLARDGGVVALDFLLGDDPQAAAVRAEVGRDLAAKLGRLAPAAASLDDLFRLLVESCCHPSNLYTEVHWLPVIPGAPEPGS